MSKQYYYLVASLRDYSLDGAGKDFNAGQIREYVRENLHKTDKELLDLFYLYYDIENIVNISKQANRFNDLGNFSLEELDDEVKKPERLPAYLARVIEAYVNLDSEDEVDLSRRLERSLYEAFYDRTASSKNRFIREWFGFDRTLRNICAAVSAQNAGRVVEDVVIGNDEITAALSRSTAADFGLKGEIDYVEQVVQILNEEMNLLEKERRLDALRWNMANELTAFNYFDMDAVLGYMVKVNMVHRWRTLDPKAGREMFAHLLNVLSGEQLFEWIAQKNEKNN